MTDALRSTHIDVELNVDTSPLERANRQIDRLVNHTDNAAGHFSQMRTQMSNMHREQRRFRNMSMILDSSSLQTAVRTIENLGPAFDLMTSHVESLNQTIQQTNRLVQNIPSRVSIDVDQSSLNNANDQVDRLRNNLHNVDMRRVNGGSSQSAAAMPAPDYRGMRYYGREMDFLRGSTRGLEADTIQMVNEMRQAWNEERYGMNGFRNELIRARYGFFQLGQEMDNWTGTNEQFMDEVYRLGREHKAVTDNMIKNNKMMRMSMLQSIGTIMAMSTQSEKI
ncbi:hypothetical protein QNI26_22580, partial [Bacillus velezensis]